MRRLPLALTSLVVAGSLVLAACGGDDEPDSAAPASSDEATDAPAPTTWPLTGLPAPDGASEQKRPVLVVKMDNTYASAPQQGLGSADLVVEELVEGGLTRLAAFYYSEIPDLVGPVRSMRASDIGIVAPVGADVVTSGAAAVTIRRIEDAGITFFQEGAKGFRRDSDRSAPYNLFTDLSQTATLATTDEAARPEDYLPFGDSMPAGKPATSLAASFGSGHTTEWTYADGTYVNENSYADEGDEFPADSVLVLRVTVGDAGYTDPAGNPVPETKLEGQGRALLFHDGRVVRGTWSKDAVDAPIQLSAGGEDLTVPAGRTWVELVPAVNGDVTYER